MSSMRPRREPFTRSEFAAALFVVTLLVGGPWAHSAQAETMYGVTCHHLVTFDSAAPATILRSVQVFENWDECLYAIDVDPRSGALYASWYITDCPILCPPLPHGVARLDPETGALDEIWTDPGWGLPFSASGDFDVDPSIGVIRTPGYPMGSNLHIEVPTGALVADTPFAPSLDVLALAFRRDGEAFALALRGASLDGFDLFRLGGVGGVPPAASGELTHLAAITGLGSPYGASLDIAPSGAAFLSANSYSSPNGVSGVNLFYSLNLATGATIPLGEIASPDGYPVTGIAVAGARGAIAIPALDRVGLATLAALLAAAGAWLLARRRPA